MLCEKCHTKLKKDGSNGIWQAWDCPKCHRVYATHDTSGELTISSEEIERRIEKAGLNSDKYAKFTRDAFREDWQPGVIREVQNRGDQGCYFYGPTGLGKTHLAVAYARDKIEQGKQAGVIETRSLAHLFAMAASFSDDKRQAQYELDRLQRLDMVVLDELGAMESRDEAAIRKDLSSWMDGLKGELWVTAQKKPEGLAEDKRLSRRDVSRIVGRVKMIEFVGKDRRLK